MKPKAVKSDQPMNAEINRYYHISISHWRGTKTEIIKGISKEIDRYSKSKLSSAAKLSNFIDEQTKISQFERVLHFDKSEYTFLIRKRLKIVFYSK